MNSIFYISYGLLWVLLVLEGTLLLLVYRHFGMMALGSGEGIERDGLAVGDMGLQVAGVTADGGEFTWSPVARQPQLVLFASAGCQPCEAVLPALAEMAVANSQIGVVAIVPGTKDSARAVVDKFHPPFTCIAENGSGAFNNWLVRVTPFGFIVDEKGKVLAKGLCNDPGRIGVLFERAGLDVQSTEQLRLQIQMT